MPELLVQREAVAVGAARDSCRWSGAGATRCWGCWIRSFQLQREAEAAGAARMRCCRSGPLPVQEQRVSVAAGAVYDGGL